MDPGGKAQGLGRKKTQPIHTGTAVRYSRSRPDSKSISTKITFAAMGRRIWRQNVGREIAPSPQAQTMRTTAEQTMNSADRTTSALTRGSQ